MKKGMTIVEALLYLVIVGFIVASLSQFGYHLLQNYQKTSHVTEVQRTVLQVDTILQRVFADAASITTPTIGNSSGTVVLTMKDGAASPTTIRRTSNVLELVQGAAAAEPLHGTQIRVTSLNATNVGYTGTKGLVKIDVVYEYVTSTNETGGAVQKNVTYHYAIQ